MTKPVDIDRDMTPKLVREFWQKVHIQPDGCWRWMASIYPHNGYGFFRNRRAHRIAYEIFIGPIPDGLQLDHLCHTYDDHCPGGICHHRLCVRPDHLEPVTNDENQRRGKKGRRGHKPKITE